MRKLLSFMMIGLITILAACGDDEAEKNQETMQSQDMKMEEDEKVAEDKVVITINDTEVNGERYNTVYLQTKIRAHQFGQDMEDKENLKEITLNEITAQELIKQEAERQGIEVSDEEVQNEFDTLKSESELQFDSYLKTYNLTEESLKEQIRFSLTLNKYIKSEIEIEKVTDEDIQKAYDQLKEYKKNLKSFEEEQSNIKSRLIQQREADALQSKVEELMEEADIKRNI